MSLNILQQLSRQFHLHPSPEREQFIRGSLESSLAITQRLSTWSRGHSRTRPCSMRFHKQWQHPECPVMKWYNMQTQSSTKFSSIQHRRSLQAPFFHEFLLIKLTDGSICRVERMGEGSRADAIRRIGCRSHDIVQWIPSENDAAIHSSHQGSELIIEIHLPRTFDLLDVLAICYSIPATPANSVIHASEVQLLLSLPHHTCHSSPSYSAMGTSNNRGQMGGDSRRHARRYDPH